MVLRDNRSASQWLQKLGGKGGQFNLLDMITIFLLLHLLTMLKDRWDIGVVVTRCIGVKTFVLKRHPVFASKILGYQIEPNPVCLQLLKQSTSPESSCDSGSWQHHKNFIKIMYIIVMDKFETAYHSMISGKRGSTNIMTRCIHQLSSIS